jgi:hypothetical protein
MKRFVLHSVVLLALLTLPASAWAWRGHHGHHHDSDVAIAVLGGIVGGIILDRVLSPPVVVYGHYHRPYDPYAHGYRHGYSNGYAHGRYRRYLHRHGRHCYW